VRMYVCICMYVLYEYVLHVV